LPRHPEVLAGESKRLNCHCERSEAIQTLEKQSLDCFVASLLAMTKESAFQDDARAN
jgi:hypothetical protein